MSQGNSAPSKIPNLYEILKLKPKEADEQLIRTALKQFAEYVKRIESPETAQQATKLFAIAKQNLLDPQRKAAYDSLWDKVFGASQQKSAAKSSVAPADSMAPQSAAQVDQRKIVPVQTATAVKSAESSTNAKMNGEQVNQVAAQVSSAPTLRTATEKSTVQQASSESTISGQASDWDLSELSALLPKGDPSAPLDLAAFLESTDINADGQRTIEDLEQDFQKLFKLLGGAVADEPSLVANPQTNRSENLLAVAAQPISQTSLNPPPPVPTTAAQPRSTQSVLKNPTQRRKRRNRSLALTIGGGIATLLCVLGFLLIKLKKNNDAKQLVAANQRAASVSNKATVNSTVQKQGTGNDANPARSGLPQPGSGLPKPGDQMQEGMNADGMNMGGPDDVLVGDTSMPKDSSIEPSGAGVTVPIETSPPNSTSTNSTSTNSTSTNSSTATTSAAGKNITSENMASSSTASKPAQPADQKTNSMSRTEPVQLSSQEKAAWKKQMTEARNLLGNREFDKADELLEKIASSAKNRDQKAQLSRLTTVAPLVKMFHEALGDSLKSLGAAEQIQVDNQVISFVEFTEQGVLKVKVSGVGRSYDMKEIPVKVAYALADLKLDKSPTSAAAKAAFAAVHKKANKNNKDEARKLMQTAAAAKVVPADTHEVFDDDYSIE